MSIDGNIGKVIGAIDADRLWRRHMEIARFGATGRGGVNRQTLTAEDTAARRHLLEAIRPRGFAIAADPIANIFIRRSGGDPTAPAIAAGSHLDTQPTGGNFDGIFGVLAAVEVLEAADDAGVTTRRPLEAIIWTNEEGARFAPATMGSAVFAGRLALETALDTIDSHGIAMRTALAGALAATGAPVTRKLGSPPGAYVEAHIEQGPALEAAGRRIGVVTGIQGLRQFRIDVTGEEAHAGTTPRSARRDALASAVEMIAALRAAMIDDSDTLRFTVGRFEVSPNSPNTIAGRVMFMIDMRHPDPRLLGERGDTITQICSTHAGRCEVSVTEILNSQPVAFAPEVVALVRTAAVRQGLSVMEMVSGATHDAKFMAGMCPTAMIFVPCARGISHNESESASPADLAAGTRVLAEVLITMADR